MKNLMEKYYAENENPLAGTRGPNAKTGMFKISKSVYHRKIKSRPISYSSTISSTAIGSIHETVGLLGHGRVWHMNAPDKNTLRDYQLETINKVESELSRERAVILQAPCGSGKTVMAAEIIRRAVDQNKRVLFLAHRRELVFQCADKLSRFGIEHAIIMAGEKPSLIPDVQVASVQTLTARIKRRRIQPPLADLIIFDECHHNVSRTHLELIDSYPQAKIIGLTATPIRGDGKGLGVAS
jgi:superfamily II DNA or RNA helicase